MTAHGTTVLAALLLAPVCVRAQAGSVEGTITTSGTPIADVVVYLVATQAVDTAAPPPMQVDVDQRALRFVPRVVVVTPGSNVSFTNSDSVMHNVFHPPPRLFSGGFDLGTYPPGERRSFTFRDEGAFLILCRIHPEMVGYVVVVASFHRAVSDVEGHFRIDSVPAGTFLLRTWHARSGAHSEIVTVSPGVTTRLNLLLERGRPEKPSAKPPPKRGRISARSAREWSRPR